MDAYIMLLQSCLGVDPQGMEQHSHNPTFDCAACELSAQELPRAAAFVQLQSPGGWMLPLPHIFFLAPEFTREQEGREEQIHLLGSTAMWNQRHWLHPTRLAGEVIAHCSCRGSAGAQAGWAVSSELTTITHHSQSWGQQLQFPWPVLGSAAGPVYLQWMDKVLLPWTW